jgi:predicted PurR-regulated permease PerM
VQNTDLRERLFFYLAFLALIFLTVLMFKPFFTVLIISLISVIMLKPVYNFFLELKWIRERKGIASSLTLLAVLVILVVPVFLIVRLVAAQLSDLFAQLAAIDLDAILQDIQQFLEEVPLVGGGQIVDAGAADSVRPLLRSIAEALTDFSVNLVSSIPAFIVQGLIFIVVVATLLPVYDTLIPRLEDISPLGRELSELYTRNITAMVKSLVLGVFLIAIIQGAAMGVVYWIAGMPYVFLLTLMSMMLAMIPMVGISWLVIGIAIVGFLTGQTTQAIWVLVGFYGVVNWIDILLRPRLLQEEASINFALFILSIFGGVAWADVMGIFYGPVIMLLLVTTVDIYAEQYAHEDRSLVDQALKRLGTERGADKPSPESEQETPPTGARLAGRPQGSRLTGASLVNFGLQLHLPARTACLAGRHTGTKRLGSSLRPGCSHPGARPGTCNTEP